MRDAFGVEISKSSRKKNAAIGAGAGAALGHGALTAHVVSDTARNWSYAPTRAGRFKDGLKEGLNMKKFGKVVLKKPGGFILLAPAAVGAGVGASAGSVLTSNKETKTVHV